MADSGETPLQDPLTSRERELMALIADDLTNQQIADRLFQSSEPAIS